MLTIHGLDIEPGGFLSTSLEELAFNGVSVWLGGAIQPIRGLVHNQGRLSVTGPFTLVRGGEGCFLNTEHVEIASTFAIEFGGAATNLSGGASVDD